MNVEIRRVANGYVVIPAFSFHRGDGVNWNDVYFFPTYQQMTDKLQEILSKEEPK